MPLKRKDFKEIPTGRLFTENMKHAKRIAKDGANCNRSDCDRGCFYSFLDMPEWFYHQDVWDALNIYPKHSDRRQKFYKMCIKFFETDSVDAIIKNNEKFI